MDICVGQACKIGVSVGQRALSALYDLLRWESSTSLRVIVVIFLAVVDGYATRCMGLYSPRSLHPSILSVSQPGSTNHYLHPMHMLVPVLACYRKDYMHKALDTHDPTANWGLGAPIACLMVRRYLMLMQLR